MNNISVDLGASSGRVMVNSLVGQDLVMEEVHRFKNQPIADQGHYYWDLAYLVDEIKIGLKKVAKKKLKIASIGFDTWGVDFGVVKKGRVSNPTSYRDESSKVSMELLHKEFSEERLYELTGIQPAYYNSLYRLYGQTFTDEKILFLPSLLAYIFSGVMFNEYTIASTSQMLDLDSQSFSGEILDCLSINKDVLPSLIKPGGTYGPLKPEIAKTCGLNEDLMVVAVPGHDTACAVAAKPHSPKSAFVVLGTWTIVGCELSRPINSRQAMDMGFTNEAGVFETTRFLKNITGLWVLNKVKEAYEVDHGPISFQDLTLKAQAYDHLDYSIDIQAQEFINPKNMRQAVEDHLMKKYPLESLDFGLVLFAIFNGMAELIAETIRDIEVFDRDIETINVVGGGSKNAFLLDLIKRKTGKKMTCGPIEASALGNALMQFYSMGLVASLAEIRQLSKKYSELNEI